MKALPPPGSFERRFAVALLTLIVVSFVVITVNLAVRWLRHGTSWFPVLQLIAGWCGLILALRSLLQQARKEASRGSDT